MLRVVLTLYFLCFSALVEARQCPVHFKPVGRVQRQRDRADCESITSADPLHALQWLTTATSNSVRNGSVAGVVDTDGKNSSCQVWSIRKQKTLRKCGPFDFSFETYWVKAGCAVTLTFTARSSSCSRLVSREVSALGVLFSSASVLKAPQNAQFLRIHDNGLGSVPATLTEMYGKQEDSGSALRDIPLVSLDLALHPAALQDEGAGHSSARAWQLWAARELVRAEGLAVCRVRRAGRGEGRQAPAPTQHSGSSTFLDTFAISVEIFYTNITIYYALCVFRGDVFCGFRCFKVISIGSQHVKIRHPLVLRCADAPD